MKAPPPVRPALEAGTVYYGFEGEKIISSRGRRAMSLGEEHRQYLKMAELEKKRDWADLLAESAKEITKLPQWQTPYIFKASAHANLGEIGEAVKLLEAVNEKTGSDRDFDISRRLLDIYRPLQRARS